MEGSEFYNWFMIIMIIIAIFVYIVLHFVSAGYGIFNTKNWGYMINNKLGWFLMEAVSFVGMPLLYLFSGNRELIPTVGLLLFEIHYFRRSIIFPLRMPTTTQMPIIIAIFATTFNVCNCYLQAGWLFFYHPENYYDNWLSKPYAWIGCSIFFAGMIINIHSDEVIRGLRKPGEKTHKLPSGGLFKYVTAAHYFGELVEWFGYAIFTLSPGALVFFIWTFANLVPRAKSVHKRYRETFKDQVGDRKIIVPFIY